MAAPALQTVPPAPASQETSQAASRSSRWLALGLAALSGLLYVLAFPGLNQWYLAFIAFVPVLWASRNATPKQALLYGAVMGLVSHLVAYYWIAHMIQTFAFMPWAVGALGWVLVALGQGASYGVGTMLARWLHLRTRWPYAVTLAVGLAAMDFCYPLVFPSYIANTMNGVTWMIQVCDLFGVLGLTAIIGAINGAIVDVLVAQREGRAFPRRTVIAVGGLWAATLVYGAVRTHQIDAEAAAAPKLKVGLAQSNVGGLEALDPQTLKPVSLGIYTRLTKELSARGVDLVVWPEGAWHGIVHPSLDFRSTVLDGTPQAVLFGAERATYDRKTNKTTPYNSAFLADRTGKVLGYYDKTILLVFGEYIPGGDWFPKIYDWIQNASHWGRGTSTAPLIYQGWKLGTYICYEDIIPRFVQQIMEPHDGARPDLMVNITNDSWYGPYMEQAQHLGLATFRAVEHHRALVRSTNTGISAIVDPAGRTVKQTPMFQEATLTAEVPKMTGTTVYEVIGDVVGWASLIVLGFVWLRGRVKPGKPAAARK